MKNPIIGEICYRFYADLGRTSTEDAHGKALEALEEALKAGETDEGKVDDLEWEVLNAVGQHGNKCFEHGFSEGIRFMLELMEGWKETGNAK